MLSSLYFFSYCYYSTARDSRSSQPLFSSLFCPHSQPKPPTLTGSSGPRAIAFFDSQSQWPAPFAEAGSGRSRRVGAFPRSTFVPAAKLQQRRTSDLLGGRDSSYFWGAESAWTLRNHEGNDTWGCGRSKACRTAVGISPIPVPEIYQLDACDGLKTERRQTKLSARALPR